jgi:hypothetical protein
LVLNMKESCSFCEDFCITDSVSSCASRRVVVDIRE